MFGGGENVSPGLAMALDGSVRIATLGLHQGSLKNLVCVGEIAL